MRIPTLYSYEPQNGDIILWERYSSLISRLIKFIGFPYCHSSMIGLDPATKVFVNLEQNLDFVSEKPEPIATLLPRIDGVILRPQTSLPVAAIVNTMRKVQPYGYAELSGLRLLFKIRRSPILRCEAESLDDCVYVKYTAIHKQGFTYVSVDRMNQFTCSGAIAVAYALNKITLVPYKINEVYPEDFLESPYLTVLGRWVGGRTKLELVND